MEITGPTLQDLKFCANNNYENITKAIFGRSVGFLIGSIVDGLVVDKSTRLCDASIASGLSIAAIATEYVP